MVNVLGLSFLGNSFWLVFKLGAVVLKDRFCLESGCEPLVNGSYGRPG